MIFHDRKHAGQLLTQRLHKFQKENPVILGLPRGGVPIAAEIARALKAPLDVLIVRKIGAPIQPELAVGAVCEEGEPFWNALILSQLGLEPDDLARTVAAERAKIKNQIELFRESKKFPSVSGRTVIVVDDGLATGATMSAAVRYLKRKSAAKIIIAVPVAAEGSSAKFRRKVDELVVLDEPEDLMSVGQWYEDFSQVTDEEVVELLKKSAADVKGVSRQAGDLFLDHLPLEKQDDRNKLSGLEDAIARSMVPLGTEEDLDLLVQSLKDKRVVMLGESSHGTEEFYQLRRQISQRLIEDHGFKFIAVEGDWPDAYRLHKYIQTGEGGYAKNVLMHNHRWPTWMWANEEIVKLAEWMRTHRAGFYGLDVYSLFESIDEVVSYLRRIDLSVAREVRSRYACFDPFEGDEISYARSLMKYPPGCENEVLQNLQQLLELRVMDWSKDGDDLFSSQQNARIVANAEAYYRAMLGADARSWNVRDGHMMDTLDRLLERSGEGGKAIVWAHNTHIGDYRATDMKAAGYVNIGGLARQSYGDDNVALVGFGTYEGEVLAGFAWGATEQVMPLPAAREDSYEYHFHQVATRKNRDRFFVLLGDHGRTPLSQSLGHRAVGVVYDPLRERRGNYVPTELSKRYDAFVFVDRTHALKSLHAVSVHGEFPETWPSGQ